MLHLDNLNEVMALKWIKIDKKLEKKMEQIEQELKEKGVSLTTPMPEEIVLKISRYQEGKQQEQEAIQQKKQDELAHKERQQKHEQKVLQGLEKTQELKGQELKTLEEDLKALHEKADSTWLRIQSFFGSSTATSKLSSYQRDIETCQNNIERCRRDILSLEIEINNINQQKLGIVSNSDTSQSLKLANLELQFSGLQANQIEDQAMTLLTAKELQAKQSAVELTSSIHSKASLEEPEHPKKKSHRPS
jgi:vacuolar-type H+-ATPase subunit I/STV1